MRYYMKPNVKQHLDTLITRYPELAPIREDIATMIMTIARCYEQGGKLLLAGNGGSCADAEHIVGELMKGFKLPRRLSEDMQNRLTAMDSVRGKLLAEKLQLGLPAIALSSHPSLNTAFMNDVDSGLMYAQQLNVLGSKGDVFLAISTSGNARNICDAALVAKAKDITVIALTGGNGGMLREYADIAVIMPCNETYQIQELHLPVYHCLCLMLEEHFFG